MLCSLLNLPSGFFGRSALSTSVHLPIRACENVWILYKLCGHNEPPPYCSDMILNMTLSIERGLQCSQFMSSQSLCHGKATPPPTMESPNLSGGILNKNSPWDFSPEKGKQEHTHIHLLLLPFVFFSYTHPCQKDWYFLFSHDGFPFTSYALPS